MLPPSIRSLSFASGFSNRGIYFYVSTFYNLSTHG